MRVTPVPPLRSEIDFDLNAIGGSVYYQVPRPLRNNAFLRQLGFGLNAFKVEEPGKKWMYNLLGSLALNLNPDPIHLVEWRSQVIYNLGVKNAPLGSFRARSLSAVTGLRYLFSPHMLPRLQTALLFAYKRFPNDACTGEQWSGMANVFYRLGGKFDLGVQYQVRRFNGALAAALDGVETEHSIKLALIFNLDMVWNNYFDERDSILNLEHGYIP